jgi:hypothetical protein
LVLEKGVEGLQKGDGPIECVVVPAGPFGPTLDDMFAAMFVIQLASGKQLPGGAQAFARYSALAREGLKPSEIPTEGSLEGIFLAIRNAVGNDLTDSKASAQFLARWAKMAERIMTVAEEQVDPFTIPLFAKGDEFARERAFLVRDREVYLQDVNCGQRWLVRVPDGPPRASALLLRSPKSLLFKYWSRIDRNAPVGDGYIFLAVDWGDHHWVFSTDPIRRLRLKSLADALQEAEDTLGTIEDQTDPWFDGATFAHTLVASPKRGTRLPNHGVLRIVKKWTHARPVRSGNRRVAISVLAACLLVSSPLFFVAPRWTPQPKPQDSLIAASGVTRGGLVRDTPQEFDRQTGKLLVLTIGVSNYEDRHYNLKEADHDAEALAKAFGEQQGRFFKKVSVDTLVNADAKRELILEKLEALGRNATSGDLVILTLSGHGTINQYGDYFFLPHDFNREKTLAGSGISWDDFSRVLRRLPCLALVIVDTCHSGAVTRNLRSVDEDALKRVIDKAVRDFRQAEKGLVVIAASLGEATAEENPDWQHGALSLAIVEGVTGERRVPGNREKSWPDPGKNGLIKLEALQSYVIERVNNLTEGRQKVVTNSSGNIHLDDVPIAIRNTMGEPLHNSVR